jgi:tight adherence protein C
MFEQIRTAIDTPDFLQDIPTEVLLLGGLALGVLLILVGVYSALSETSPGAARLGAMAADRGVRRFDQGLLKAPDASPGGLMKAFVPASKEERSSMELQLAQAGMSGANALMRFTLVRVALGLVLPLALLALIVLSKMPEVPMPPAIVERFAHLTNTKIFALLSIVLGLGYFGPVQWLKGRVAERQQRIREGFPNALDLMQISLEAGLGFDAAMTRVGNELATVSPDIAFEFLSVQRQVQAGRSRDAAMQDMANRIGLDVVHSFANVVAQSIQFGTSMSSALATYSEELREYRETMAQEMANKLPVKMSAVLAALMLPALILLTVGPVVIRFIRFFEL